ncbi:hypothetical protein [Nocardioides antri]|uniref:Uncharacterized protein n=1 Tax=Nocardioides antri TaxID=2607659 RepID=A0A5B1M526_9ACTN|nr:hypothetical protein [Nocardioides antri]KAA1427568.1 hypothetical protein F0U47_08910 [Nocardioides antri]
MTDFHADPGPDPLAGRDPHPREQIDLWPLHDARQELLEEIVSQPGPGSTAGRTKVLLSVVGIAAALVLVVGGAWAVTRDDSGGSDRDDQLVASSEEPTSEATTDSAEEPTKDRQRDERPDVRVNGVEIGSVESLDRCLRVLRRLDAEDLESLRVRKDARRKRGDFVVYLAEKNTRYIAVDHRCRIMKVGPRERRPR